MLQQRGAFHRLQQQKLRTKVNDIIIINKQNIVSNTFVFGSIIKKQKQMTVL